MLRTIQRPRVYEAVNNTLRQSSLVTYPFNVSTSLWVSPSTSKILIVLSEEHVANRLP